ncbi:hypothetical protein GRJ2_000289300 [Grus japonensis]|uniref:Uncharacterized protein n=1 Tax=Grus japonensis TaxID=30415 RepID=A0ABC9VXY8_GRUJA
MFSRVTKNAFVLVRLTRFHIGLEKETKRSQRDVSLLPAQEDLNKLKERQSKSLNTSVLGEAAQDISWLKIMLLSSTAVSTSALFLIVPQINLPVKKENPTLAILYGCGTRLASQRRYLMVQGSVTVNLPET